MCAWKWTGSLQKTFYVIKPSSHSRNSCHQILGLPAGSIEEYVKVCLSLLTVMEFTLCERNLAVFVGQHKEIVENKYILRSFVKYWVYEYSIYSIYLLRKNWKRTMIQFILVPL